MLLVEDELHMVRALERFFCGQGFEVVTVRRLEEARRMVSTRPRWAAFVVDVGLPDGDGLELLARARAAGHRAPALVLTARNDRDTLERAQIHAAQFLPKPPPHENLLAFARWARAGQIDEPLALDRAVSAVAEQSGLSPRETELLALACRGVARAELAGALDVEETTVRTLIRRILQKTQRQRLMDLVREVQRSVFA